MRSVNLPFGVKGIDRVETPHIVVHVGDCATDVLVDSGATCNNMDYAQFEALRSRGLHTDLRVPSQQRLFAYGSHELTIKGEFHEALTCVDAVIEDDVVVMEGEGGICPWSARRCQAGSSGTSRCEYGAIIFYVMQMSFANCAAKIPVQSRDILD